MSLMLIINYYLWMGYILVKIYLFVWVIIIKNFIMKKICSKMWLIGLGISLVL